MRPRIFIDMDGVLTEFVNHACQMHNSEIRESTWPVGEWDIAKVLGISKTKFWKSLDCAEFWMEMPVYDHAHELIQVALDTGFPVAILSSPARGLCAHFKRMKVEKEFPGIPLILAHDKSPCCDGRHTLLIDDHDKNIDSWIASGGTGIRYPRRWNRLSVVEGHVISSYELVSGGLKGWARGYTLNSAAR